MSEPDGTESKTAPPTVRRVGEWHLVTANNYQVSVGPDSVIMLPRHIHPSDVPDFIAAISVAADVGMDIYRGNIEMGQNDDRSLAQRKALISQGGAPAGTVRMKVEQRQAEQATIGRPNRRSNASRQQVTAVKAKAPNRPSPQQMTRAEKRRADKAAAAAAEEADE